MLRFANVVSLAAAAAMASDNATTSGVDTTTVTDGHNTTTTDGLDATTTGGDVPTTDSGNVTTVGGDNSTVTEGQNATTVGGDNSTVTEGHNSTTAGQKNTTAPTSADGNKTSCAQQPTVAIDLKCSALKLQDMMKNPKENLKAFFAPVTKAWDSKCVQNSDAVPILENFYKDAENMTNFHELPLKLAGLVTELEGIDLNEEKNECAACELDVLVASVKTCVQTLWEKDAETQCSAHGINATDYQLTCNMDLAKSLFSGNMQSAVEQLSQTLQPLIGLAVSAKDKETGKTCFATKDGEPLIMKLYDAMKGLHWDGTKQGLAPALHKVFEMVKQYPLSGCATCVVEVAAYSVLECLISMYEDSPIHQHDKTNATTTTAGPTTTHNHTTAAQSNALAAATMAAFTLVMA